MESTLGFAIAKACIVKFLQHRPIEAFLRRNEWTVISAFVLLSKNDFEIVAMGSGTTCLNVKELADVDSCLYKVHDCHAEIIARRAFLGYLINQAQRCKDKKESVFDLMETLSNDDALNVSSKGAKFRLKSGLKVCMFSSQAPCGDASQDERAALVRERQAVDGIPSPKKFKDDDDGVDDARAKVVFSTSLHASGIVRGRKNFDGKGLVRTKPGRADSIPTTCMSCSDKIALWNAIGLQGALLDSILASPIYIETFLFGKFFSKAELERALVKRSGCTSSPQFIDVSDALIGHPFLSFSEDARPSPLSSLWIADLGWQNIVKGLKEGASCKRMRPSVSPWISRFSLSKRFQGFTADIDCTSLGASYQSYKHANQRYQERKKKLLDKYLMGWIRTSWPKA